jgi:hypothetical protein
VQALANYTALPYNARAASGKGKRGGLRIIYLFKKRDGEIWLLTLYAKGETDNIPAHVLRQIAEEIRNA